MLTAAGLVIALVCCVLGSQLYSPVLASIRGTLLPALIATGLALAYAFRPRRGGGPESRNPEPGWLSKLRLAAFGAALLSVGITTSVEARFQIIRSEVLAAPSEDLARIGRHIIIGVDEPYEARKLIEAQAISGIFVTRRNARGKSMTRLAEMIKKFDEQHRARGGAPLWVTADQEGGLVQRLSPPLPYETSLPAIVRKTADPIVREAAVRAFASQQAKALAAVGVNVNFSPVVDIDFGVKNRGDRYTRISRRAISSDPAIVAEAARWYCEALWAEGVRCTRKHFPGLGRVFADTHIREATLNSPIDALVKSDWVPFESPGGQRPDWVMVGHMKVSALDPNSPASASPAVIGKLRELGHNGIVVTDDFSMGAIQRSKLGIGGAAVAALNSGVDLILISYDSDQIYLALHALLKADRDGSLDRKKLEDSEQRLKLASEKLSG